MENSWSLTEESALFAPVLDIAGTRELEKIYLQSDGYGLMQYAAGCIFSRIKALLQGLSQGNICNNRDIWIFAGGGNNGGDGYEIATGLVNDGFVNVMVVQVLPQKKQIAACRAREVYLATGGREITFDEGFLKTAVTGNGVIIDAILGIGVTAGRMEQKNPVSPSAAKTAAAVSFINRIKLLHGEGLLVISVDIPSLLDADRGIPAGETAVTADITYTVFTEKPGLLTGRAKEFCGRVEVVADGLPRFKENVAGIISGVIPELQYADFKVLRKRLPRRSPAAHKGTAGKVLLVGGSAGMTGALILAASAAVRCGSGLVAAMPVSGENIQFNSCNPCIMTPDISELEERLVWADAVAVGPGLGRNNTENILKECIIGAKKAVFDADALYLLANSDGKFPRLPAAVLTPHAGEAARLCGVSVREIEGDMVRYAIQIAEKYQAVCVLKSSSTVIATQEGKCILTRTGCSGMASGGMGDVLTGVIVSLMGQGYQPESAAVMGVLLHGEAGRLEAEINGNIGMCATDIPDRIRQLVNGKNA